MTNKNILQSKEESFFVPQEKFFISIIFRYYICQYHNLIAHVFRWCLFLNIFFPLYTINLCFEWNMYDFFWCTLWCIAYYSGGGRYVSERQFVIHKLLTTMEVSRSPPRILCCFSKNWLPQWPSWARKNPVALWQDASRTNFCAMISNL